MLEQINSILWCGVTAAVVLCGLRLSLRTGFLQFTHFGRMLRCTLGGMFKKTGGISPFSAVCAALSGTMGTGNIIGVGIALQKGGAGALLWMLVSSFLSMIVKYAEVYLAVEYRESDGSGYRGGPMYYIVNGISRRLYPMAVMFCIFTLAASFCVGNATQASALSSAVQGCLPITQAAVGVVLALGCAAVIFGSVRSIASFTGILTPVMSLLYLLGAGAVIAAHAAQLPTVLCEIFADAISADALGGGLLGFLSSAAFHHGFSKGMFTNEAGMGSAPIVHAAADNTPEGQGYFGIFEVFVDTTLMCSVTGLAILLTGSERLPAEQMTAGAFGAVFGSVGERLVSLCVILFAFAAIIGWSVYGSACCEFLFSTRRSVFLYRLIYCAVAALGCCGSVAALFELSDLFNGLMAVPNLAALWLLRLKIPARRKLS